MRVLHLSSLYPPASVGGAEKVVEMLAEGMASQGVAAGVAHLVESPVPDSRRNGVDVRPLQHRNPLWIESSARYPGIIRNFNKVATLLNVLTTRDFDLVLRTYAPDIVHSHSMMELTPWMWQAAKGRGIKVVHTLHDFDLLCIRGALFKDGQNCVKRHEACALFSAFKKRYHQNVDHVVGVSRSILETHLEHGMFRDMPEERRHVVWNPVRAPLSRLVDGERLRAGPFTFGFMGRLVSEKGIDLLLTACRDLPRDGWCLKVAGRAPTSSEPLQVQARGLPVEFVGFVDPAVFLKSIDVLVVPSVWAEPFGLTVVEAFAHNVPVIGLHSGGIGELVGAVNPAWLVSPTGGAAALSAKMLASLVLGRENREALPDFFSVLKKTDPRYVVSQYLSIYRNALGVEG
jgi:glycogen(starch) synthase